MDIDKTHKPEFLEDVEKLDELIGDALDAADAGVSAPVAAALLKAGARCAKLLEMPPGQIFDWLSAGYAEGVAFEAEMAEQGIRKVHPE
jgi:hypothetical protein